MALKHFNEIVMANCPESNSCLECVFHFDFTGEWKLCFDIEKCPGDIDRTQEYSRFVYEKLNKRLPHRIKKIEIKY